MAKKIDNVSLLEGSVSVQWEDPPSFIRGPRSQKSPMCEILRGLLSQPGRWAHVGTYRSRSRSGQVVQAILRGAYGIMRGEYEATMRAVDGEFRVYARYVGGSSNAER